MEQKIQKKTNLQRISNILLINGGFLNNSGLYTGEMGIVLFFSRYARFTQNELYTEYCFGLIEKIQTGINQETLNDYRQGLTGIGSTIEYLVQNGFFNGDTDDILEDFDKKIFSTCISNHLTFYQALDIWYYALWRISGNSSKKEIIKKTILTEIVNFMKEKSKNLDQTNPMVSFFYDIISTESIFSLQEHLIIPSLLKLCRKNNPDNSIEKTYGHLFENISSYNFLKNNILLGFQNGLAGLGVSILTELDGDDSWISLFPYNLKHQKNELISV